MYKKRRNHKNSYLSIKYKNEKEVLPFILPGLILMVLFVLYPLLRNIFISFTSFNIILNRVNDVVYLENYIRVFSDGRALYALTNTLLYGIVTVPIQIILGLIVAVLINTKVKGSFFFKVLYYIPVITSWLVVSLVFKYLFESGEGGLINYFLLKLGLVDDPIGWFTNRWTANIVIWVLGVWKGIGWVMVVYLAGLQGINKSYYEAADVDGANSLQKHLYITIPALKPITFFILTNLIIGAFSVFIQVLVITDGAPMGRTEVLLSYMYKVAFSQFNIGYSSALSVLIGLFIFGITYSQQKFLRFGYEEK
ncbi:sugar ABC transporter permease [Mycoplasmatota bacterium zrk1]